MLYNALTTVHTHERGRRVRKTKDHNASTLSYDFKISPLPYRINKHVDRVFFASLLTACIVAITTIKHDPSRCAYNPFTIAKEAYTYTSARPAMSHKSFQRFPDCPIEVRLKIWGMHLCIPRIVEITYVLQDVSFQKNRTFAYLWQGRALGESGQEISDPKIPVLLSVNQESRAESMRHYIKCFTDVTYTQQEFPNLASRIMGLILPTESESTSVDAGGIYINLNYDIIFINEAMLLPLCSTPRMELKLLQRICMEVRCDNWISPFREDICQCSNLRELTILMKVPNKNWLPVVAMTPAEGVQNLLQAWRDTESYHPQWNPPKVFRILDASSGKLLTERVGEDEWQGMSDEHIEELFNISIDSAT